ncbi:MAG TPA: FAD-binding oxidoreductase [Terriglobia bacterium]|nr:FAD-binding oxidoreductase [Terriglobia bacterium]
MSGGIFAKNYKNEPYWWDAAPRPVLSATTLPAQTDVLVIGSGYTGLSAATETARAGRSTLVIDAESAGWGCSSRNGGQVSTSIKPGLSDLSGRHNEQLAFGIRREGIDALDYITHLVEDEKLDCDWNRSGRFHAAHNPKQFEALVKLAGSQPKGLEVPMEIVTRAEQRREIGSDAYYGGIVYPRHSALHPGKFHLALLKRTQAAGAIVVDHCPALSIDHASGGFTVKTAKGTVQARDVVVATNGYTGPLTPWHRRRVIPIGSYIIATEELDPALAHELAPTNRMISDTRRVVFYYRLSPDRRRMIFGGRVAYLESNPEICAPRLHDWMCRLYPQLKSSKVTHSWMGFVAYTFDTLPHIGKQDGLHFAMGYCGSGVSLATYFGRKIGLQVLGKAEGKSPLDNIPFQTRPLYSGNPWFLAPSVWWYRLLDGLPI